MKFTQQRASTWLFLMVGLVPSLACTATGCYECNSVGCDNSLTITLADPLPTDALYSIEIAFDALRLACTMGHPTQSCDGQSGILLTRQGDTISAITVRLQDPNTAIHSESVSLIVTEGTEIMIDAQLRPEYRSERLGRGDCPITCHWGHASFP